MEKTLQDLADLVLAALPTTLLVVILWIYLKIVLFNPLHKTAADRDAATKGAVQQAQDALRRAEQKADEYEHALRAARGEILRAQDAQRQTLRQEQSDAVLGARASSAKLIEKARAEINEEASNAKVSLSVETERLAGEIASAVLKGSRS